MIERSLNYRRIKKLIDWPLIVSSKIIYLIESDKSGDKGVWSFFKNNDGSNGYMIHADMGKNCRGKRAIQSARIAFKWIFDNTGADFIKAEISRERIDVCSMAYHAGMKSFGLKNNLRHFKITR